MLLAYARVPVCALRNGFRSLQLLSPHGCPIEARTLTLTLTPTLTLSLTPTLTLTLLTVPRGCYASAMDGPTSTYCTDMHGPLSAPH